MTLPRKQSGSSSQEAWVKAWHHAQESARSDPDYRNRHIMLIDRCAERLDSANPLRPTVAWSGGKDSIALEVIAHAAGIFDNVLVTTQLEFPAFMDWVESNAPDSLYVHERSSVNIDWLSENQDMMFPQSGPNAGKWFRLVQHTGQREFMARTGGRTMLLGRRTADGNYCGPARSDGMREYIDPTGYTNLSPIADLSHEDVLGVIAVSGKTLPPNYEWPRGFRVATGPWAKRRVTSDYQAWAETATIDRSIVVKAALHGLRGAREYLSTG